LENFNYQNAIFQKKDYKKDDDGISVEDTCWYKSPEEFIDNDLEYQNWFDSCNSVQGAFSRGYVDFFSKILIPQIYGVLGDPSEKTSLEIGFGGGRLINAASKVFKESIGIDVLSDRCIQKTKSFLEEDNVLLYNYANIDQIKNASVDFVYSFIVFQHFTKIKYYHMYLDAFSKKMKKNAVGNIFFTINNKNADDYYFERDFASRECSMFYSPQFVKSTMEEHGFKILSMTGTTKSPWSDSPSKQFSTIFLKK